MRVLRTLRLATRDYRHEWQMSGCFVLALAAVLGPMLVLFGLKFGIIGGMLEQLVEDPANREIRPVGSARFETPWLDRLRKRPDVAFLAPRTRSIAATLQLKSDASTSILNTELIASGHSDPLLSKTTHRPEGLYKIVLSQSAATRLAVGPGDRIDGSLARKYRGKRERVHLPLEVVDVAPVSAFGRNGAFVDVLLLEALEDFRDGNAVPALAWGGATPAGERTYPSFRLYASSIYDVSQLREWLDQQGIEVRTRASDIELVMRIDRNLSTIYWAIAIIGLIGFSLSLGASLWANVDRKRKELSVLRLVGFRTGDIIWFPIIQAFYTALLGWALAVGIYRLAAFAINNMLSEQMAEGQLVCVLLQQHYVAAAAISVVSAVIAAALAGIRSARIEPSEGLREI